MDTAMIEKPDQTSYLEKLHEAYPATKTDDSDVVGLFDSKDDKECGELGQENEDGPVEYKLKLVNPSEERFVHLVSQLKYRLQEGHGEAIYEVGVEDSGHPLGLTPPELEASLTTLHRMAASLKCEAMLLRIRDGQRGQVAEVLVRRLADVEQFLDIRICVIGNVDSGKSTLVGVLTRGQLDDGRGLARANVFRHKHEIENGRTSSISHQILGYDSKGHIINYSNVRTLTWSEIVESSSKILTFIDLAGHEKYLKTTVFGLTGQLPDYALVAVASNNGVLRMTKEHLGITLALRIPLFVVVTKVDICPPNILQQTLDQLTKILKSSAARKIPLVVRTNDDVMFAAKNLPLERITPIFLVSNVTSDGLDLLKSFMNLLPARKEWCKGPDEPAEFHIDETFYVSGVGTVVAGTVIKGTVVPNQTLLLGPDSLGSFAPVIVKSIHTKRVPVKRATAGQTASFALKKVKRSGIRKGMVLVDPALQPQAACGFEAEVLILHHPTTIQTNYQPVVHLGSVRQTARIKAMSNELMRTGDRATVEFEFCYRAEYITEGTRLIFREGRTKGIGKVTKVIHGPLERHEKKKVRKMVPAAEQKGHDHASPSSSKKADKPEKKHGHAPAHQGRGDSKKAAGESLSPTK